MIQSEFVQQLKKQFDLVHPIPASRHSKNKIFVYKELQNCSHVFVRTLRPALKPPYERPFAVLRRNDKFFIIQNKGKESTVSINRLKPCFFEASDENISFTTSIPHVKPDNILEPEIKIRKKVTFQDQITPPKPTIIRSRRSQTS